MGKQKDSMRSRRSHKVTGENNCFK